jgi:hypothetical protein
MSRKSDFVIAVKRMEKSAIIATMIISSLLANMAFALIAFSSHLKLP